MSSAARARTARRNSVAGAERPKVPRDAAAPAGNRGERSNLNDAGQALPRISPPTVTVTEGGPDLTPAEVYAVIRGRLAVLVLTKRPDGSILTRPYVNMRAADRAVARARERGCTATAVLVRQDVAPLVGGESS